MAELRDAIVHQAGDISLKGIGAGIGVIMAGIVIAVCVPWAVIVLTRAPANAPNDAAKPRLAAPVQETAPFDDIAAFRREKTQRLESYGVDAQTGRVHIPIERAMELLVQRGRAGEKP